MDMLGFVGFIVGIVGLVLTVYYAVKADRSQKRAERSQEKVDQLIGLRRRLDWSAIQSAAIDLANVISEAGFFPTAIVTPGLSGATFANLFVDALPHHVPVYVGIRQWKETASSAEQHRAVGHAGYFSIETPKWHVQVPCLPDWAAEASILILDDFVMSGDFLSKFREKLIDSGAAAENIRSAAIVTTSIAKNGRKGPDFSWLVTKEDDFYFPWGKAR